MIATTEPVSQTVNPGATATFSAAAIGNPSPTGQWQVSTNGGASYAPIAGATSTTLSIPNVSGSMAGNPGGDTNGCGHGAASADQGSHGWQHIAENTFSSHDQGRVMHHFEMIWHQR